MQALQDLYEAAEEYWNAQSPPVIKTPLELMNDLADAMTDLMREMKTQEGALSSNLSKPKSLTLLGRLSKPRGQVVMDLTGVSMSFDYGLSKKSPVETTYRYTLDNGQELTADGTRVTITGHLRKWRFQRVGVHGYLTYRYDESSVETILPINSKRLPDSFISDISSAINHVLDANEGLSLMCQSALVTDS